MTGAVEEVSGVGAVVVGVGAVVVGVGAVVVGFGVVSGVVTLVVGALEEVGSLGFLPQLARVPNNIKVDNDRMNVVFFIFFSFETKLHIFRN